MHTKTEVVLCSSCEGKGYIVGHGSLLDYHRSDFSPTKISCKPCGGSGRMVKKTTVTYEKFVDDLLL